MNTAATAVDSADVVVVCVLDHAAAEQVLDSTDVADKTVVNVSSGTPEQARLMAHQVAKRGGRFLAGALMAIPPGIGDPSALILAAGDADKAVLHPLGTVKYVGSDPGAAALYDMALLSLMWTTFGGYLSSVALVDTAGIPVEEFTGMATDWLGTVGGFLTLMGTGIAAETFPDGAARLDMQVHTMRHVRAAMAATGVDTRLLEAVEGMAAQTVERGYGHTDFESVITAVRPR